MHRLAALLLCSLLVAVAVTAAPAPVSKPRPSKVWVDGWDKPVDQVGDCRFARVGDSLTIVVPPSKDRWITGVVHGATSRTAPHMLRDVAGDFAVQVRVTGDFDVTTDSVRGAGVLLKAGRWTVLLSRSGLSERGKASNCIHSVLFEPTAGMPDSWEGKIKDLRIARWNRTAHLRLERRGDRLVTKGSRDGAVWTVLTDQKIPKLPASMKLGVFAQAINSSSFEAVFDQFEITPLK
jgi:regulation of enolase protein 1 (concanavalin A-like superfamily)